MIELSVNKFRSNLKDFVDQAIDEHEPVKITRRKGRDFIVISAEDWAREQETLNVLQNSSLMKQIAESLKTHNTGEEYKPSEKDINEINSF